MSQRKQVSLGDPTLFSSYLMDQVFLQDGKPPGRHPTSSALRRETEPVRVPCHPEENDLLGLKFVFPSLPPPEKNTNITMTNYGDDCFFFYYSTCSNGDSCPFRHCEAAMGSEAVCNLWQEGRCFRTICKFRHMKITKNRKEIACYWENQPAGCQKPHCAFQHQKARYIDGAFVPPDKSVSNDEQPVEEPATPSTALLPTAANPQLRGVIKTETTEPVPSPTHPPVVINPADDDEDEDDQFSEEGEDGKAGPSPRKLPKSNESLNFGVSTLEEIRLRKALKASMRRAGYPIQSSDTLANGEKENLQSFYRPGPDEGRDGPLVFEESGRPRGSVAERIGKKRPITNVKSKECIPMKRSLAERLGRVMDDNEPPQKALNPMKDRLGLPAALVAPTHPAENNTEFNKGPEQIRIKTLEEIKQEKAAKSRPRSQNDGPAVEGPESTIPITTKANRGFKRAITIKDDPIGKTSPEIFRAKKKAREEQQEQNASPKNGGNASDKAPGSSQAESNSAGNVPKDTSQGTQVRVKTLEEIRREKAARIRVQQSMETETKRSSETEENVKKHSQLQIKQKNTTEVTAKPLKTQTAAPGASPAASNDVKVKTFEEIMREKRLRKQELEEQDRSSNEADLPEQQAVDGSLKKTPANISLTPPCSLSPSSNVLTPSVTAPTQKPPARQHTTLNQKTALPKNNTTRPATTVAAVAAVASVKQRISSRGSKPNSTNPRGSREGPNKNIGNSPAKQSPNADKALGNNRKKTPESTRDTKERPKLNVKPSVMKPAAHLKPCQKWMGAEQSAVAAVKPLKSSCTESKEPLQETVRGDGQVFLSPDAVLHSPSTLLDSGSSLLREEPQTVAVKRRLSQETKPTAGIANTRERLAPSTSSIDEFDELLNEFTGDDLLEDDKDLSVGEDDLLQELSEMIDS